MKKGLTKSLSILGLASTAIVPLTTASCGNNQQPKTEIHLMCVSDIHGEIPGYGDDYFKETTNNAGAIRMADAMQEIADKSAGSIILSGGDQNSAGTFSSCTYGDTMYPVLKAMNIQYSAVGNHAWDWGLNKLEEKHYDTLGRTDSTKGNYFVSSNILSGDYEGKTWESDESKEKFNTDYSVWNHNRVKWTDPYKVVDLANHKICLIGLTTQRTKDDGNQKELIGTSFIDYIPCVHYAKKLARDELGAEKYNEIESFILFTHCGGAINDTAIEGEIGELAYKIDTPIDAILGAHTHGDINGKVYNNKFNKPITITETRDKMQTFADLKFNFDDTKPVGQRFKSIESKIIAPNIEKDFNKAAEQINNITKNPRNQVVKNVCETYNVQKIKAKEKLTSVLGHSQNGIRYYQKNNLFDYKYPIDIDPTKVGLIAEPAGAFVAKSQVDGVNDYIESLPSSTKVNYKKASVSYIGNSSIRGDIDPNSDITLKEAYDLFAYENTTILANLTYFQLKQIVNYMFAGAKFEYQKRHDEYYQEEFQFEYQGEKIVIPQLRYPYGPNQFYGFAFKAKQADNEDPSGRRFKLDETKDVLVYDPDNNDCKIDDPTTWKGADYWEDANHAPRKYITIVMSNFDFLDGNKMNKMIQRFAIFNQQNQLGDPTIEIKELNNLITRETFAKWVEKQSSKGNIELSDDVCKKLIEL